MAVQDASKAYEFVMGFIASSDDYKRQYVDRWREVLANYMVDPIYGDYGSRQSPYEQGRVYRAKNKQVVLKDPETHKAIMTYAAKLVRTVFGSREREYIKAKPRGYEDATTKAPTVSRLLRYDFALPGMFRTFVEAVVDMLLYGTSVVEVTWEYCEREMPVRTVVNEMGFETDSFERVRIPIYDDPKITPIDVVDFYPDPTRYRIADMAGAAKRFKMNAIEARYKSEQGIYDKSAVEQAIRDLGQQSQAATPALTSPFNFQEGISQPADTKKGSQFREMIGYEYWGDVPWSDDYGSSRRVVTVLNNVVVRNDPWPLADAHLPWHTLIINPMQGRFYGVSPAEVIRHDQDFADAIKILLAEAIIRQVHPPIAVDPDSEVDVAALRAWKADAIISARGGPASVGTLRYDANVMNGFNMLSALKGSMQEASGALGGIQGEPGPDREAATVGNQRIQMAMDRPELAGMLLENECLPPIAAALLRRNQQFLDTQGLALRIGEQPAPFWIGDIMGDYDIEFVGSRMSMSRQEKLQSLDRLAAMSASVPPFQAMIPWQVIAREMIGELLQLPEVAAQMQDPEMIMMNMLMMQQLGGGGGPAQNGVPAEAEPAGMLPAQASGAQP